MKILIIEFSIKNITIEKRKIIMKKKRKTSDIKANTKG